MRLSFDRLWVVIALALPALLSLLVPLPAVDLAYQVRAGDEILASGALPAVDTWTYTIAGAAWVDQQWLAQVLLALGYRIGGWELLAVARAGLVVVALGLLLAALVERGTPTRIAAILTLVAFLLAAPALALRPQLFAIALFAALLWLIAVRWWRPWAYLLMPVVVVLWANVHGSFVLAPLVLGYAFLEDVVAGREWGRALLVLLVGTAATLLNPFGLGAWAYAASIGTDPVISGAVSEWQRTSPLTIPGALFYASLVAAAVFLATLARAKDRVLLSDWVWLAGWGLIGAWAERGLAWWPFAAAFLVATVIGRATGYTGEPMPGQRANRLNAVVALALGLLVVIALPWWRPTDPLTGRDGLLSYAPSGAAQALRERARPGDRVVSDQTWASWLEWAVRDGQYFLDSRFELFPSSVFVSYAHVWRGGPEALAQLEADRVRFVLVPAEAPLASTLRAAGWAPAFQDARVGPFRGVHVTLAAQEQRWSRERKIRLVRDGLSILGVLLFLTTFRTPGPGFDFFAYWNVDPLNPYTVTMDFGAFHYAPPLAWPAFALHQIAFDVARFLWLVFSLVVLVWLTGKWALAWLAFVPVSSELFHGNIHLQMAALLVIGWAAWIPLAKPTAVIVAAADIALHPRRALLPVATASLVVILSILIQRDTWSDWIAHLLTVPSDPGGDARIAILFPVRLLAASVLSFAAWRLRRTWLLAPALALSLPILWFHSLAVLTAVPRLYAADRASRGVSEAATTPEPDLRPLS